MAATERQDVQNEVHLLSILSHPNIVAYYDSFYAQAPEADGELTFVIVMECAGGGNLHDYLQQRSTRLTQEKALFLFTQVALALQHIHAHNILHRDLKTHNVFIQSAAEEPLHMILKVADFGISKLFQRGAKAETTLGTPNYLSPEQCEGKEYDEKSDIWALGCILHEVLSLQKLFQGPTIPSIILKIVGGKCHPAVDGFDDQVNQLATRMVAFDPALRPDINAVLCAPCLQQSVLAVHLAHAFGAAWQTQ
ncbi:Serine/threonine-protein kinase Nek8 [Sorochytrium milnesiophthora]